MTLGSVGIRSDSTEEDLMKRKLIHTQIRRDVFAAVIDIVDEDSIEASIEATEEMLDELSR